MVLINVGVNGGIINTGDTWFPFFPSQRLHEAIYMWDFHLNAGIYNIPYWRLNMLPIYLFAALLGSIGVPLWVINRLWFITPLTLLGWSIYHFTSIFIRDKHEYFSRLVASLFLILNPYIINQIVTGHPYAILSHAGMIFTLGFFINGIINRSKKYIILASFSSVLMAVYPPFTVIGSLLILLFLLFYLITRKNDVLWIIKFSVVTIIIALAMNAWLVILGVYGVLKGNIAEVVFPSGIGMDVLWFTKPYTSLIWVTRLLYGYNILRGSFWSYYETPAAIFSGIGLVILAYISLFFRHKSSHEYHFIFYFSFLALISTILCTGVHYPQFAIIYVWFLINIPLLQMFRVPLQFLCILVTAYSCLISVSIRKLLFSINRNAFLKIFAIALILASISANSLPLLDGSLSGLLSPIEVQSDYYKLREYLITQKYAQRGNFRVFVLPLQMWYTRYKWWHLYDMPDVIQDFSPVPLIENTPGMKPTGILELVYESLYNDKDPKVTAYLLGLLNVKYIILHKDIENVDISDLKSYFDNNSMFFTREKVWDNLELYKLNDVHFTPHLYAATNAIILNDSLDIAREFFSSSTIFEAETTWTLEGVDPRGLAFDGIYYYVGDIKAKLVKMYDATGNLIKTFGSGLVKYFGHGVATDGIYIWTSDYSANRKVYQYRISDAAEVASWVIPMDGSPMRIAYDKVSGNLFITIYGVSKVYQVTTGGTLVSSFNVATSEASIPIACNEDGNILITDGHILKRYSSKGVLLNSYSHIAPTWGSFSTNLKNPNEIIQLDVEGQIYRFSFGNLEQFAPGKSILFLQNQLDSHQLSLVVGVKDQLNHVKILKITYTKVNPIKYVIHIENANGPFFLVLSESYHKDWVAYVDGKKVPPGFHLMANGYANAWYINKTATYTITLEFWPQKLFYTGSAISIITLIFCVFYISKNKIKALYSCHVKRK